MGHTRLCGSHGRLHHMAVAVVQSGSIGNVINVKMGGIWAYGRAGSSVVWAEVFQHESPSPLGRMAFGRTAEGWQY